MDISILSSYIGMLQISPVLAGGAAGFLRAGFGYLKARFKHGEAFAFGKFGTTLSLTTILGGLVGYFMIGADPVFIGAVAMSGGVIIDSIVYMLIGSRGRRAE